MTLGVLLSFGHMRPINVICICFKLASKFFLVSISGIHWHLPIKYNQMKSKELFCHLEKINGAFIVSNITI